ncbi:MAG: hypothetical protein IJU23_13940 [Proteobacteria bacterium]|nr:hypothetical protein [Pseudomonadota bacterium]
MASSTMKSAAPTPKQHKAKRSLRKAPKHQSLADKESLAIDLSKPEMDAIFTGLYTGQLENPQMAANKVYALALDALEKTLCEGLDEFYRDIEHNSLSNSDNPFAPWIARFIPKDHSKILSIREDIKNKIGKAKHTVTDKLTGAFEADAEGNNLLGKKGQMTADAIRDIFDHVDDIKLPGLHHYLSKDRLKELSELIKLPIPDDGVKRYTISNLPDRYRFSFGTPASASRTSQTVQNTVSFSTDETHGDISSSDSTQPEDTVSSSVPQTETATVTENTDTDTRDDNVQEPENTEISSKSEQKAPSTGEPSEHGQPVIPPLKEIIPDIPVALSPEMLNAIKEGAEDCVASANEVTEILKEMAVQITEAAMQAYREEHFKPTLADILRENPETENDAELLAFIQDLESGVDTDGSSDDDIDNEELTSAFSKLLDDFD